MPESRVDRHRKNKNEMNSLRPSYCRRRLSKLQARENQTANTTDTTNGVQFFCEPTRTETNAQETNTTLKGAFHSTTTLKMSTPGLHLAFTLPWGSASTSKGNPQYAKFTSTPGRTHVSLISENPLPAQTFFTPQWIFADLSPGEIE